MFTRTLLHAIVEMPKIQGGAAITQFLPKTSQSDPSAATALFYPLAMGHISQPAGMKLPFGPVPAYCIFYVTKNSGIVTSGEKSYDMPQSSLLIFDCSLPFSIASDRGFEYDVIYYAGPQSSWFYDLLMKENGSSGAFHLPSFASTGLSSSLRPLLPSGDRTHEVKPLEFHRYMTDFFTELADYASPAAEGTEDAAPDYLRVVKEYIDNNFYKNITLDELENLFFISRFRVCKDFTAYYYISPIQYLHRTRIKKAQLLLKETTLKVHEIGYQVGYESTTQFINHFKKHTGKTPAVYRS
ncbi:MAG: helix-turn-helix transcriptional regulator [Lachnospiraceae bacterium]|nr:helix-turn-helix transcriptional regulator [Lachnospiraceae bacterium]